MASVSVGKTARVHSPALPRLATPHAARVHHALCFAQLGEPELKPVTSSPALTELRSSVLTVTPRLAAPRVPEVGEDLRHNHLPAHCKILRASSS
jgi:hypothetical protein